LVQPSRTAAASFGVEEAASIVVEGKSMEHKEKGCLSRKDQSKDAVRSGKGNKREGGGEMKKERMLCDGKDKQ
jgi:hypothetical protein